MVFTQLSHPASLRHWGAANRRRTNKIHRYEHADLNSDFCLEAAPDQSGFLMTSCKSGVRGGDLIQIRDVDGLHEYRVDEIDYYSDPADMWIAKLRMIQ
ncbi:hypothetical protein [Acaryochloris sp. IP29b_bin.137]|uniref:hypothetical protein n=1 Tax=Acaryochloris sp. IP29b_bin.137 TaxID=2969217 RepID=UPI00261A2FE0|nr:hypothetical protein [Acaryochloris sp. IP29b_bin.137]